MSSHRMSPDKLKAEIAAVLKNARVTDVEGNDVDELYEKMSVYHEELEFQNEELKRVSADLELAKSYLTDLYETAPVAYITFDRSLRILSANRAFRHLLGVKENREIKTPWNAHLTPESQDSFYFHHRALVESGASAPCLVGLQRGGRTLHLKLESNRQSGGSNPEFRSTLTDLSGEHEAEAALRLSEARFRGVVDHAADGILLADASARIVEWNHRMESITGWTAAEALGRSLWEVQHDLALPEEKTPESLEHLRRFILTFVGTLNEVAAPVTRQRTICDRAGTRRYVEFTIFPLQAGEEKLIGCIFRDISETRHLQEELNQAKKTEAIGLLAGGIAHDFNNLLGIIFGRLELAKLRPGLPPPLVEDLAQIEKAARQSAQMTRQLLTYARKQAANAEPIHFNQTINQLLPMLARLVAEDVAIEFETGDNLPLVLLDPSQLGQILTNLCANARDAMGERGTVRICTRWISETDRVALMVEDSGSGMDADTQSHLFEPFFTTKKLGHGTGLGLATVHGIVYQNRGDIRVTSGQGKGTVFTLTFPAHRTVEEPQAPPLVASHRSEPRTCRVLVVDDEPEILDFVVLAVGSWGHQTRGASSAEAALVVLRSEPPFDLLITDVQLPGMAGNDLAVQALKETPGLRVLYMSGYSGDHLGERGLIPGRVHFLQKPFDMAELHARVDAILAD